MVDEDLPAPKQTIPVFDEQFIAAQIINVLGVPSEEQNLLKTLSFPSYFAAKDEMTGPSILQGPHQSAQKSTSTGTVLKRTSSSKLPESKMISAITVLLCFLSCHLLSFPRQLPAAQHSPPSHTL